MHTKANKRVILNFFHYLFNNIFYHYDSFIKLKSDKYYLVKIKRIKINNQSLSCFINIQVPNVITVSP